MMRAFIFPGQGSQNVGMGSALAQSSAAARAVLDTVDAVLGERLSAIMADGPDERLRLTEHAQPAIMAHSMMVMAALGEAGVEVDVADCVAGHSLGEYSALCAAGSLALADTARLLKLRGRAMQAAVPVGEGAMAALLGADIELARRIAAAAAEGETCSVANDNDPSQVVLSGSKAAIDRAIALAKEMGAKRALPLPVSAPFHCALMQPAAEAMAVALKDVALTDPVRPLYANVTASAVTDANRIRSLLVDQVTGRVRWRESVVAMGAAGVGQFVEIGGKVLGPMVKRILPDAEVISLVTADDVAAFAAGQ